MGSATAIGSVLRSKRKKCVFAINSFYPSSLSFLSVNVNKVGQRVMQTREQSRLSFVHTFSFFSLTSFLLFFSFSLPAFLTLLSCKMKTQSVSQRSTWSASFNDIGNSLSVTYLPVFPPGSRLRLTFIG